MVEKEKNDFKKLETNFENVQKEFVEEKEKTAKLENELKEMDKVWMFLVRYLKIILENSKNKF